MLLLLTVGLYWHTVSATKLEITEVQHTVVSAKQERVRAEAMVERVKAVLEAGREQRGTVC